MRILLDNCVPADLAQHIRGHEVSTAAGKGWSTLDDRPLLDGMIDTVDILLTVDKNIPFQQVLGDRPLAVIILRARTNRVGDLARLVSELHRVLRRIAPGEVLEIS